MKDREVAYALDIPNKGIFHDVFYFLCLNNKVGDYVVTHIRISLTYKEGKLILELEDILEE
jgi:hypothetical protein